MYKYGLLLIYICLFFLKPGKQLYLFPGPKKYIEQISTLPMETLACLEYVEVLGDVYVYNYYIPTIYKMAKDHVRGGPCPTNTIPFHNHPYQDLDDISLQRYYTINTGTSLTDPNQLVYMSYPDMRMTYFMGYTYAIVGSNGEWAWWSSEQINCAGKAGIRLLRPIYHQSTLPIKYEFSDKCLKTQT